MSTTCFKPWALFLLHAKEGQASPIYKMQSQTPLEDGKAMGDQMAQAQGPGTYLIQASSDMHGEASVLNIEHISGKKS